MNRQQDAQPMKIYFMAGFLIAGYRFVKKLWRQLERAAYEEDQRDYV